MNKKYTDALKHRAFNILSDISKETGISSYVVGGFVRDYFLGIANDDIDIVIEGSGIEFAKEFSNRVNGKLSYFENYGTAMVKCDDIEIEFVGARKEMYERGSRKPIVENGTLYDDISRRDFTINAMAISLNHDNYGELIDYFNGLSDLNNKIIKTPLDPNVTFSDDPLRMFRAVRFLSKLEGFTINDNTYDGILENYDRCSILSRERITMELEKMISYDNPINGFKMLYELNLWDYAFPNNPYNEINVISSCRAESHALRWFFLSIEYDGTYKSFVQKMKLPNDLFEKLDKISYVYNVFCDLNYPQITLVRHCLDYAGSLSFSALDAVLIKHLLLNIYCKKDVYEWYDSTFEVFSENKTFINYKHPYNGEELMKISGLSEGYELGMLMKKIKEEILRGELGYTKASVYAYVKYQMRIKK